MKLKCIAKQRQHFSRQLIYDYVWHLIKAIEHGCRYGVGACNLLGRFALGISLFMGITFCFVIAHDKKQYLGTSPVKMTIDKGGMAEKKYLFPTIQIDNAKFSDISGGNGRMVKTKSLLSTIIQNIKRQESWKYKGSLKKSATFGLKFKK